MLVDPRWADGAAMLLTAAGERGIRSVLDADSAPIDARLVAGATHCVFSEHALVEYAGERAAPSPVFARMIDAGRRGRKGGKGFYDYSKDPKRVDEAVYNLLGWQETEIDDLEIIERCWMQMLNETARCMEEDIITNPTDVDIGVIMGFGFPPFRGGILREADKQGVDYVVARLEDYAEAHGERLAPAQLLRDMAAKGERFHKLDD